MSQGAGTQPAFSNEQTRLLKQIADDVKITNVKLFGASQSDDENTTGRLPIVERSAKRAHDRIDDANIEITRVEKKLISVIGMAAGASGVISALLAAGIFKVITKN